MDGKDYRVHVTFRENVCTIVRSLKKYTKIFTAVVVPIVFSVVSWLTLFMMGVGVQKGPPVPVFPL